MDPGNSTLLYGKMVPQQLMRRFGGEAVSKEADIQVKERGMHHQLGREAEKAFRGKAKHGAGGGESEDGYHSLGEDRRASIGYKGG